MALAAKSPSPLIDPDASPTEKAIYFCGGARRLAEALSVTGPAVDQWRKRHRIPAEHILAVEKLTDGFVTRYQLRPDIYPPNEAPKKYLGER